MISEKLIIELQEIIHRQYGKNLSLDETAKIGNDLVKFFDVLARVDFKDRHDNI